MRHVSNRGLELIKRFEGYSSKPYRCPAGYWTIGYGHLIRGEIPESITRAKAEKLLKADVSDAERAVVRLTKVPLTNNQFDALVSFVYNLGSGAYQRSSLRSKLNRMEYDDAANEFLRWCRAGGKVLKGLVLRRKAERDLFLDNTATQ